MSLAHGELIPIEQRDPSEVTSPRGTRFAPDSVKVLNPAFDVTPSSLITAIVTDLGIIDTHPLKDGLEELTKPPA
jgi:methylthioribose-1-phosphate isomerase